jgi:hypothetical protein
LQHVEIMGDTGCASVFIYAFHVREHKYELIPPNKKIVLELAYNDEVVSITHMTKMTVSFSNHTEKILA